VDALEAGLTASGPPDLYAQLKLCQRELELLSIQEEYIKDESRALKRELLRAQQEVRRIQSVPLTIGQFLELIDDAHGIVSSTSNQTHYVRIMSTINRELLKPNSAVALHRYSNALVDTLPNEADSSISMMQMTEKPDVSYADIGGLDVQKQEIREAVELPLTHFQLYRQIGIDPPKGVLLYGPPGTGPHTHAFAQTNKQTNKPTSASCYNLASSCDLSLTSLCLFLFAPSTFVAPARVMCRQDDDGQGRRSPHHRSVHPRGRFRVCAEVFGRRSTHGARCVSHGT
jgi:26S proteasome regulatory subunit T3